jgi:hypothetical protein
MTMNSSHIFSNTMQWISQSCQLLDIIFSCCHIIYVVASLPTIVYKLNTNAFLFPISLSSQFQFCPSRNSSLHSSMTLTFIFRHLNPLMGPNHPQKYQTGASSSHMHIVILGNCRRPCLGSTMALYSMTHPRFKPFLVS